MLSVNYVLAMHICRLEGASEAHRGIIVVGDPKHLVLMPLRSTFKGVLKNSATYSWLLLPLPGASGVPGMVE